MKKQSGFTLIELMVVMAIIAILATAGLAAYTGYIKKARDTTRIADINAINTIILGSLSTTGKPPQTAAEVHWLVTAANNGQGIYDPLLQDTTYPNGTGGAKPCYGSSAGTFYFTCPYTFRSCDNGQGYAIGTRFESKSNISLYRSTDRGVAAAAADYTNPATTSDGSVELYEIGSCMVSTDMIALIDSTWPYENGF